MTEQDESQLPIFRKVNFAGSDPTDSTITVLLGTDDDREARLDFSLGVIGPLLATLSAEALKLSALVGDGEERNASATLNANGAWLSEVQGNPTIVFELANGALLPMVIKSGDFAGLAREMMLMASPPGTSN